MIFAFYLISSFCVHFIAKRKHNLDGLIHDRSWFLASMFSSVLILWWFLLWLIPGISNKIFNLLNSFFDALSKFQEFHSYVFALFVILFVLQQVRNLFHSDNKITLSSPGFKTELIADYLTMIFTDWLAYFVILVLLDIDFTFIGLVLYFWLKRIKNLISWNPQSFQVFVIVFLLIYQAKHFIYNFFG